MTTTERIVIVPKRFWALLLESLNPYERILMEPPADLWTDKLKALADRRFKQGQVVDIPTPEGHRRVYFMRANELGDILTERSI